MAEGVLNAHDRYPRPTVGAGPGGRCTLTAPSPYSPTTGGSQAHHRHPVRTRPVMGGWDLDAPRTAAPKPGRQSVPAQSWAGGMPGSPRSAPNGTEPSVNSPNLVLSVLTLKIVSPSTRIFISYLWRHAMDVSVVNYPRGSPRPRCAMMFRWISVVPPPMGPETASRYEVSTRP